MATKGKTTKTTKGKVAGPAADPGAGVAAGRVPMYAGPKMAPGNRRVKMAQGRKPKY